MSFKHPPQAIGTSNPSVDEPIPGYALVWNATIRRPSHLPEDYDTRIATDAIFFIPEDKAESSLTSGASGLYVVRAPCRLCKIRRQVCSRSSPKCRRCIAAGCDCVSYAQHYNMLPGPKTSRGKNRPNRSMGIVKRTKAGKPAGHFKVKAATAPNGRSTTLRSRKATPSAMDGSTSTDNKGAAKSTRINTVTTGLKSKKGNRHMPKITSNLSRKIIGKARTSIKLRIPSIVKRNLIKGRKGSYKAPQAKIAQVPNGITWQIVHPLSTALFRESIQPPHLPQIWATDKQELRGLLPKMAEEVNGVIWDHIETPILFLEGQAWPTDSWNGGKTIELTMARRFTREHATLDPQAASKEPSLQPPMVIESTQPPDVVDDCQVNAPAVLDSDGLAQGQGMNSGPEYCHSTVSCSQSEPPDMPSLCPISPAPKEHESDLVPPDGPVDVTDDTSEKVSTAETQDPQTLPFALNLNETPCVHVPTDCSGSFASGTLDNHSPLAASLLPLSMTHGADSLRPDATYNKDYAEPVTTMVEDGVDRVVSPSRAAELEFNNDIMPSATTKNHPDDNSSVSSDRAVSEAGESVVQYLDQDRDVNVNNAEITMQLMLSTQSPVQTTCGCRGEVNTHDTSANQLAELDVTERQAMIQTDHEKVDACLEKKSQSGPFTPLEIAHTTIEPNSPCVEVLDDPLGCSMDASIDQHVVDMTSNTVWSTAYDNPTVVHNWWPPEIKALMNCQMNHIPVSLVICRDSSLLPFSLPPECGCAYLGFFFIQEIRAYSVDGTDVVSMLQSTHGQPHADTGEIRWRFKFEWTPGGYSDDPMAELLRPPWWMATTTSANVDANTDSNTFMHPFTLLPLQILIANHAKESEYETGVSELDSYEGWHCSNCGKVNLLRNLRFQKCDACQKANGIPPVGLDYVRNHNVTARTTWPWDRPSNGITMTLADHEDKSRLFSYQFAPAIIIKHLFTCNLDSLQQEPDRLFRDLQVNVELVWCNPKEVPTVGSCHTYHVGDELANTSSITQWNDVPECVMKARGLMERRCSVAEPDTTLVINSMSVHGWMKAGRRKGCLLPAKHAKFVLLCLGADVELLIYQRADSDEKRAEGAVELSANDQIEDVLVGDDDVDAAMDVGLESVEDHDPSTIVLASSTSTAPVSHTTGKATAPQETLFITLVHGDILILEGSDFEYTMRRTGMSIVVVGAC